MNLPELASRIEPYVEQQNSVNTRAAYIMDLAKWLQFLQDRGIKTPSVEDVIAFKTLLEDKYAQNTARRIFATVRAFYSWLRKQDLVTLNPFELVKSPATLIGKAPTVPTDVQVERILRAVDRSSPSGKRHYAILTLLLNGLRVQEVCDLRQQDHVLDNATRAWMVRVVGKGMKERYVPLTREAIDAIEDYRQHGMPIPGEQMPLIQDILPMGGKITRKQISYVVDKYSNLAGVHGVSPHSFRHHYGTRIYRASRDVIGVGKLLGHSKPETTAIYARLDMADLVEVARLDPRNPLDESEYHAKQA